MGSQDELEIQIPRDRNGEYTPEIIKPYQNDISDFDQNIITMYARGMTTRDIQAHVYEIYGANISAALVSRLITLAKCIALVLKSIFSKYKITKS